ncbi:hypothetical protein [Bacillus phage BC-T25]|nr:hypothetical protein [Bacillus phage BC-T25]
MTTRFRWKGSCKGFKGERHKERQREKYRKALEVTIERIQGETVPIEHIRNLRGAQ